MFVPNIIKKTSSLIFACFLNMAVFGSSVHYKCHYEDSLSPHQIDSILEVISKNRFFIKKVKNADSVYYYYFTKNKDKFLGVSIRNKENGTLVSYYLIENELSRVIFRPKKRNNERTGGLYYFFHSGLIHKEEYNIEEQNTDKFLVDVIFHKIKAKAFLNF